MRVLLFPFQSDSKMKRCSTYHWTKVFVRELTKDAGTHVYWPVPTGQRPPDEFLGDQVTLIPIDPMQSSPYYEMMHLDERIIDQFHSMRGEYVVDAIVSFKPLLTPFLRRRLCPYMHDLAPPVVLIHSFLIPGKRLGVLHEDFRRMQAGGSVGLNVFANEAHEALAHDAVRPYLSPSEMRRVETLGYYFSAFDPRRVDACAVEKPHAPITLCYAQAMNSTFQYEEVLEEMDLLYRAGRDVRLLITTSSETSTAFPKHYEYVEQHGNLPQDEFLRNLHRGHVFVALIKDMEMCSSMLEQMYAGQIGILPNVAWARAMTPEGYPFLYDSKESMRVMLRQVVEHYWEYTDLIEQVREFIRDKYDAARLSGQFREDLLRLSRDKVMSFRGKGALGDVLDMLDATGVTRITWNQLVQFLKKHTRVGLDLNNIRTSRGDPISRWSVHWTMQKRGWKDTCTEEMPIYTRAGGPDGE